MKLNLMLNQMKKESIQQETQLGRKVYIQYIPPVKICCFFKIEFLVLHKNIRHKFNYLLTS